MHGIFCRINASRFVINLVMRTSQDRPTNFIVWPEDYKRFYVCWFQFWKRYLHLLFTNTVNALALPLGTVRLRTSKLEVTEIGYDGDVLEKPGSPPALISSFRQWSLPFSTTQLLEPKLGMFCRDSVSMWTLYLLKTLHKGPQRKFGGKRKPMERLMA